MDKNAQTIMDGEDMSRAIARIAHEIVERNGGVEGLCLIGVQRRGVPLAGRIAAAIGGMEGVPQGAAPGGVEVGELDITFYRDDLTLRFEHPVVSGSAINFPIEGKTVVLVDDVLFTGRTVRAAIDALMDYGRPAAIQLAVLVDRGHRELPIRADYVGKNVPSAKNESVRLFLAQTDGRDTVEISELAEGQKPGSAPIGSAGGGR